MENLVHLAKACQDIENIHFLILGNGSERKNLEELVQKNNLPNLELRKGVSHQEYFNLVQLADVGLISLSEDFTIPNIPSKALSYYNAKKPILASIDRNTDFGKIMEDLNVGLWAEATNTEELKTKLVALYESAELRKKMGENGYRYMRDNLTSSITYKTVLREAGL